MRVEPRLRGAGGFTLVELLLALALTAVVALLVFVGIENGSAAASRAADEVQRLVELQRALAVLDDDLAQVQVRALNHGVGEVEPAFSGGVGGAALLEFTRGGVANPLQQERSDLQRVRYLWRSGGLWRQHWYALDRQVALTPPQEMLLLADVESVGIEFLPASAGAFSDVASLRNAVWETQWNSRDPREAAGEPLPRAVRLTLTTNGLSKVQRVYALW